MGGELEGTKNISMSWDCIFLGLAFLLKVWKAIAYGATRSARWIPKELRIKGGCHACGNRLIGREKALTAGLTMV